MKYVLLLINFSLIIFLLSIRYFINNNTYSNEDAFLGRTFLSFRMEYAEKFQYIIPIFFLTPIVSLILKCNKWWKLAIISLSLIGFLYYNASHEMITPW